MENYYKVLGVRQNATQAEIRRAYRQKAKLFHPDMATGDMEEFRRIQNAYEVLTDVKVRELFDQRDWNWQWRPRSGKRSSFDYRKWLLERQDDESACLLILFDLMHGREDDAVEEYKKMNMERPNFRLSRYLTREDFMDWGFILSEELVLRQEYYDAIILLGQIVQMEKTFDYFRFFFPEVLDLVRHVLYNNIEGHMNEELALDTWERALEMELGNKDNAFFLMKMADIYEHMGDRSTAEICRKESVRLANA